MLPANHSFSGEKLDPDDCEIKPNMGLIHAQNQPGWGITGTMNSWFFDPSKIIFNAYGNWCGPNHPKPGTTPEPFDKLDAACRAHDLCYAQNGYSNCSCDAKLVETLRQARERNEHMVQCKRKGKWTKEPNHFYDLIGAYFETSLSKSNCDSTNPRHVLP